MAIAGHSPIDAGALPTRAVAGEAHGAGCARSDAALVTESQGETGGYDTNNDTKMRHGLEHMPQLVESMVELSGIEPLASSLRTRRSPS